MREGFWQEFIARKGCILGMMNMMSSLEFHLEWEKAALVYENLPRPNYGGTDDGAYFAADVKQELGFAERRARLQGPDVYG